MVATEGGHIGYAPASDEELDLLRHLRRTRAFVEVEAFLSGPGLVRIHDFLCARDGCAATATSPADISAAALAGSDARCVEAARWFLAMLGSVAGDLALVHGATGGIYLGGGVLERLLPLLGASQFRERFVAKGILGDYLREVPVQVIRRENAALHGAAYLYRPG